MKVGYKIVESYRDKDTNLSITIIKIKDKYYKGTAKLHPNDVDYDSSFIGCEIAEYRAYIKYLKEEKQNVKRELETLIQLRNRVDCYKHMDGTTARYVINKTIDVKKEELNEIEKRISSYINIIPKIVDIRQAALKKIHELSKGANS